MERAFDAFTKRDLEAFLGMTHEDVEVMLPTAEIANEGRPYIGHEGVRAYFQDIADVWEELRVIPQLVAVRDDVIVVIGRAYARGVMGITDTPAGWVVRQADGRVPHCTSTGTARRPSRPAESPRKRTSGRSSTPQRAGQVMLHPLDRARRDRFQLRVRNRLVDVRQVDSRALR